MRRIVSAAVRAGALATVLSRLVRITVARPPIGTRVLPPAPPDEPPDEPPVTVVIPARDEAGRVGPAIVAILGAPGVREVVVVDDESTDRTASVSSAAGARIVDAGPRPSGWAGKTWAVQRGIAAAMTEWVLVLDADTRADRRLPAALVARAIEDRLDLLTVAGAFRPGRPGARWLHASMLATLVYRFGPPGTGGRVLANGQCMLVRRREFSACGGMAPVAGALVEDVALARALESAGRRVAFVDATALLDVEPYPTLRATWIGWGRSVGLPGVDPFVRRLVDVIVLALVMPLPIVRLLGRRADVIDVVAAATRFGTLAGMSRAYRSPRASYWLSPFADPVAIAALVAGLVKRRQSWRGRTFG